MTYDPTIGKWISEDPIGFAAGDSNISRYVGNSAWNKVDPSGLTPDQINLLALLDDIWIIDKHKRTITLTIKVNVSFANASKLRPADAMALGLKQTGVDDWIPGPKIEFINAAKMQIERYFNSQSYSLAPNIDDDKSDNCIPSFTPRIAVSIREGMADPDQRWIVISNPNPTTGLGYTHAKFGAVSDLQLTQQDVILREYLGHKQVGLVHEFGHAIGLDHPGGHPTPYDGDAPSLMGRAMEVRPQYFRPWAARLEREYPDAEGFNVVK